MPHPTKPCCKIPFLVYLAESTLLNLSEEGSLELSSTLISFEQEKFNNTTPFTLLAS
jgi:hypothetical protein